MGNSQNSVQEALHGFKFAGNKYRSAYGSFKLLVNENTAEKIAVKAQVSNNFSEIEEQYNVALILQESQNRFFLSTTGYLSSSESLCSNFHKLSIYVEYIELTLADSKILDPLRTKELNDDLHSRRMNLNSFDESNRVYPRDFSENDYLHIIFCVASGLSFLHQNDRYHGCINPWNILESNGSFKIGDHLLLNGVTCFNELMSDPSSKCFISPELFQCLPNGEIDEGISQHKADIFALGMTVLCLIKGLKPEIFYSFNDYSFNQNILQQHLQSIKFNFSEEFHDLLCAILDMNPVERLSSAEVLLFLNRVYGPEEFGIHNFEKNIFNEDRLSERQSFNEGIKPLDTLREEHHMQPPMEYSQDINYVPNSSKSPNNSNVLFKFGQEDLTPVSQYKFTQPIPDSLKPLPPSNNNRDPLQLTYSQISHGSRFSQQAMRKSVRNQVSSPQNSLRPNDYNYNYNGNLEKSKKNSRIMYSYETRPIPEEPLVRMKTDGNEMKNGNRIDEVLKKSRVSNSRFESYYNPPERFDKQLL